MKPYLYSGDVFCQYLSIKYLFFYKQYLTDTESGEIASDENANEENASDEIASDENTSDGQCKR